MDEGLLAAERDIQARLGDRPLDFESGRVISNIYRAAAAVRRQAERTVLGDRNLSWGGFTILWVLWVWGDLETGELAAECDLAKGTLTGMVSTLEKQGLVVRHRLDADKRRVVVSLTDAGDRMIDQLYPMFNDFESKMTVGLTEAEQRELSRLLRVVITNAAD